MRNNRRFHRCFCGHAGYIEGSIRSFHDQRQSFELAATSKQSEPTGPMTREHSAAMLLPSPERKGPPAKR
jgi:hypothetical protein